MKMMLISILLMIWSSIGTADHRVCIDGLLYEVYYTLDASSDISVKHLELMWDQEGVCRGKGRV